jgi:hypothetical protein
MNPLLKFIVKLFWSILYLIAFSLFLYFFYYIFELLGITINIYGNYLIWIVAMGLFYVTLPKYNKDSIFS